MSLISTWSTVADANGTLGGTPNYWPEGQAPSTVNNCARLMMATIRSQWNDAAWFNWGYTVTRVSGNSFTVVTASWNTVTLPAAFEANARIKLLDSSTLYGTITTVSVSALSTLVTFTPDAGSLTSSFSSVYNSIIPATNTPIPGLNIPTDVVTQKTQQIYAADTGATNSAQITLVPTLNAYATGEIINFKAANTNTGATTLQVDALGTKTIKKDGGGSDLAAGDIIAGQMVSVLYDGTNFQMVCPTASGGGGGGTAASRAQMEDASSVAVFSSPGRQQYHPGHPKAWGILTVTGGVGTLVDSYNLTGAALTATGEGSFTMDTDFASANYAFTISVYDASTVLHPMGYPAPTAGVFYWISDNNLASRNDPNSVAFCGLGDQV